MKGRDFEIFYAHLLLLDGHVTEEERAGSDLSQQPLLELRQSERAVREGVLLRLVHLGISLALILEDWIPAYALVSHVPQFSNSDGPPSPLYKMIRILTYQN